MAACERSGFSTDLPSAADLARATLRGQHPITRGWRRDADRLVTLELEHEFDLRLARDARLAARRAEAMGFGHAPEALLNRWVIVAGGLAAMFSIRFEAGDSAHPFVDVWSDPRAGARRPARAGGHRTEAVRRVWTPLPSGVGRGNPRCLCGHRP